MSLFSAADFSEFIHDGAQGTAFCPVGDRELRSFEGFFQTRNEGIAIRREHLFLLGGGELRCLLELAVQCDAGDARSVGTDRSVEEVTGGDIHLHIVDLLRGGEAGGIKVAVLQGAEVVELFVAAVLFDLDGERIESIGEDRDKGGAVGPDPLDVRVLEELVVPDHVGEGAGGVHQEVHDRDRHIRHGIAIVLLAAAMYFLFRPMPRNINTNGKVTAEAGA